MRRTVRGKARACARLTGRAALLGLSLLTPAASRAEEAATEPPRPFLELGRLIGTAGVTSLEGAGAGAGGLVPWALITGYGSRDGLGANVHATGVRLTDFSLGATGIGVGVADRLELSYQHQWFDTHGAGARLGLGRGYTFEQDIFGAKLRLVGDVVADQDRWWRRSRSARSTSGPPIGTWCARWAPATPPVPTSISPPRSCSWTPGCW